MNQLLVLFYEDEFVSLNVNTGTVAGLQGNSLAEYANTSEASEFISTIPPPKPEMLKTLFTFTVNF